ncbi:MAG: GNAT family N-acetyltransferase [Acidobacteria bacterium]|nr:GNAT family N-acetyltransferase [Acidobacteriota bacterium]
MARKAAAPPPACRVDVVTGERAFLDLEPAWDGLVRMAGLDHPFLSHAWVRSWWDSFGAGRTLYVLLVRAGAELVALAPLMLDRARMYGLPQRRIGSLCNDHTPRFDLAVAGRQDEACRAIWSHLKAQSDDWDLLELRQLPEGSTALERLARFAEADRFLVGSWRASDSPYVPLREGWERYFMTLSHNHRAKLRKRLRRLERQGSVALETIESEAGLERALDDGWRLEACGWKNRAGTAILRSDTLLRFYACLARHAARAGMLRLFFLTVGGARIAFAYALSHANKLYVLKSGYDIAYAGYSPYNLLTCLILEDCCRRGLEEYDFLGGNDEWKLHWTGKVRPHDWLYVFPDRVMARFLHGIKFRVVPRLASLPLYRSLRDGLSGSRGR